GTGELAILVAEKGHRVVGIDCSERAITSARAKAANRAPDIEFQVADAEHLQRLDVRPRTVLDSGLLHNLDDPGRRGYVAGLERICDAGAVVCVLAVSAEAGAGWDLTRDGLDRLFPASAWGETNIETAEVLADVDGDEIRLPSFLLTARRAH
ncbi:MAG: class I SAM-dependent methyltransferase, partial [Nocardioidaceae bacterium]